MIFYTRIEDIDRYIHTKDSGQANHIFITFFRDFNTTEYKCHFNFKEIINLFDSFERFLIV